LLFIVQVILQFLTDLGGGGLLHQTKDETGQAFSIGAELAGSELQQRGEPGQGLVRVHASKKQAAT
jgi:hypothetical protein